MNRKQMKRMYKNAVRIHERLIARRASVSVETIREETLAETENSRRLTTIAAQNGWQIALRAVVEDRIWRLERLSNEISEVTRRLKDCQQQSFTATAADIYRDLVVLNDEFESVQVCDSPHTLTISTEAIELDGIYLGPFDICLDLSSLQNESTFAYEIIATDPHPADCNSEVTHPHVQHQLLCEGDATVPIRKALQQGRLLDFFQIVATVLRTYNSDSPHVDLADWHGVKCDDCGYSMNSDDVYHCDGCEGKLCNECLCSCSSCDSPRCNECIQSCEACGDSLCKNCLTVCDDCSMEICNDCLNEEARCDECYEKQRQEAEQNDAEGSDEEANQKEDSLAETAGQSGTAVQSDGVGKTTVPA